MENSYEKEIQSRYTAVLLGSHDCSYYLCPEIMTGIEARAVCVDEREGMTYGLTRDWIPGSEPEGVCIHNVIFESNGDAFWEFVTDICSIDTEI